MRQPDSLTLWVLSCRLTCQLGCPRDPPLAGRGGHSTPILKAPTDITRACNGHLNLELLGKQQFFGGDLKSQKQSIHWFTLTDKFQTLLVHIVYVMHYYVLFCIMCQLVLFVCVNVLIVTCQETADESQCIYVHLSNQITVNPRIHATDQ